MGVMGIARALVFVGSAWLWMGHADARPAASLCTDSPSGFAQRAQGAATASAFLDRLAGSDERERDLMVRRELLAGNIPGFLRALQPVRLEARLPGGEMARITLCVLADYLSVGSDEDFLRVPMGLDTALSVAARFGFVLPTRRIVDLIYGQSPVHLTPQPLPAGEQMRSTAYYRLHNALVQAQREAVQAPADALTAGQKKDLVVSPRLWEQPGRVAIYGWHRGVGAAIQPLSTVHGAHYADYSHGVRLVSNVLFVNDEPHSIFEFLADPQLSTLLSDEGPLPRASELFVDDALARLGR